MRRIQLTQENPSFVRVRFGDGHESTVLLKDLAPCPDTFGNNDSKTILPAASKPITTLICAVLKAMNLPTTL